ncbi:MAG: ECF transporter S component [Oscillospiraceae bacterium]|jgi:uncharacterized membrane protein|nr:ECF transporter S component [Oscillospiraceae bacterium]
MSANRAKNSISIQDICITALFAALSFTATYFVKVQVFPGNGGLVHFGNIPVVVAAVCFGRKQAAISGAVGMTLFDIVGGYFLWAPFTCVIRLAVGWIIGYFASKSGSRNALWALLGIILGGLVLIAGYYLAEGIIYGNFTAPALGIPGNSIQIASMAVVGLPIAYAIKGTGRVVRKR